ncbi:MAG: ABC-F type ribosomal protection protein [Firmicutes bacterium]|nr:ABC-F type ribosomal protection protein [Bacillota bacterium]
MLILEANNIKKYYGDRLILDVPNLKIYQNDRIGLVGMNGAGKTTLMDILSQRKEPDEGSVKLYGKHAYINQLEDPDGSMLTPKIAKELGVDAFNRHLSGGEKTRVKIAQGLSANSHILFADEPTCNLDVNGIKLLEEKMVSFDGALLLISHDRTLLDNLCNKIIEVCDGTIKEYMGNYSHYKTQKEMARDRQQFEYEQYIQKKQELEKAITDRSRRAGKMKKTPARMGNSEARLHKRSTTGIQAKLRKTTKALETRVEKLEKKEKPKEMPKLRIDIPAIGKLYGKVVISGEGVGKAYGEKVLFQKSDFQIYNGDKVAFIGNNGTGKTTLLRMILAGEKGISTAKHLKIAYFSQALEGLDENSTILEDIMETAIQPEYLVRTILARLLIKGDDVYKGINVLSGGERVKVAFAKIFVQDINMMILDEPTNFLDTGSIEALEEVLQSYKGTLLFVSHDRRFIRKIADKLMILEHQTLTMFDGDYNQYMESKEKQYHTGRKEIRNKLLLMENKLSEITIKLCMPSKDQDIEALDRQYKALAIEIKQLQALLDK